ncbi:MAG: hypothetical protein ACYDHH_32270 [Solirubrobacteraceae bacterium]
MGRRSRRRAAPKMPADPSGGRHLADLARRVQEADEAALALHRELDAALLKERRSGATVTALAAATGFSRTTVHKALNRAAGRAA